MQIKGKKGESINIQLVMTPQDVYKKLHIPNSSVSSFVGGQSQNLARASADRSLECEGALSGTNKKNLSNGLLEPQLDRFDFIAVSCFRSLLISVSLLSTATKTRVLGSKTSQRQHFCIPAGFGKLQCGWKCLQCILEVAPPCHSTAALSSPSKSTTIRGKVADRLRKEEN